MCRNKERYDLSGSTREAAGSGVASAARIITGAAPIIIVVFAGVAHGQLAIALLLDAAVIRSVVLPSMLSLLDVRSWDLACWLDRLPDVEVEKALALEVASP
jgi:RND superfamily putative drug exporter